MDFLKNVKLMLGITDGGNDELLKLYIDMARQEILNYCNTRELPAALNYILVRMVVDVYREQNMVSDALDGGQVSNISEDGRRVDFDTGSAAQLVIAGMKNRLSGYPELKNYRKLFRM